MVRAENYFGRLPVMNIQQRAKNIDLRSLDVGGPSAEKAGRSPRRKGENPSKMEEHRNYVCMNFRIFVYKFTPMRTNIVLNEQLVKEAMRLSNSQTKKEVVDLALQNFVAYLKRQNMKNLFGKVTWEGDLKTMREI